MRYFFRVYEQRLYVVSLRSGNHTDSVGDQIWRSGFLTCRNASRQFLVDGDVIKGSKIVLQALEALLIARQRLLTLALEKAFEKINRIVEFFHCNAQFMPSGGI